MTAPFSGEFTSVNTNSVGNSSAVSSTESGECTVYIVPGTGTHATHVIEVQITPNGGTNWVVAGTITGLGYAQFNVNADEYRFRVSTAEGAASTVDIYILGR